MQGISCFINFKENLSKNAPYYNLLLRKIDSSGTETPARNLWIGEQAALCSGSLGDIVTKISEGYQFTIAFFGSLCDTTSIKNELCSFGYHFLSDKDAELALLCYIHFGQGCYEKLSGSYSFIVYDSMRRQVFALSDKDAEFPLFYAKAGDGYVLSSSLKGIFACPEISKNLTTQSVLDLLCVQNRIPRRIFEDVYILPHAHSLRITAQGLFLKEHHHFDKDTTQTFSNCKDYGIISTLPVIDMEILDRIIKMRRSNQEKISVYAEEFSDDIRNSPVILHNFSVDDGAVYSGLEASVTACGVPVLSDFDYRLPIAIRSAKGNDETLIFPAPDRFLPQKSYLSTLIKNDAFHRSVEKNFTTYTKSDGAFLRYPTLIADHFDVKLKTPVLFDRDYYNKEEILTGYTRTPAIKTALRHILLDIISKEHSPVLAFFKRSALLRLCEGSFSFLPNQSECELTAYLIKLNMWFEIFRPRII